MEQVIRFPLGRVCATPGALAALVAAGVHPGELTRRHQSGDFGVLDRHDDRVNRQAIRQGLRILSSYPLPNGQTVWVITEADRSVTTLLLPEDY